MPTFQITCDTPGASIYYTTDGNEPDRHSTLYTGQFTAENSDLVKALAYKNNYSTSTIGGVLKVGAEIMKDGITSVCIYDAGSQQDWGRYIFVDKNHDLCYYITGDDYVNSNDWNVKPGTFGYEWGAFRTITNISSQEIGKGLSNTNSLITMNLQPSTSGWRVLWDMVEQFRSSHSNNWFVPTLNELLQVWNQGSYLNNLSYSDNKYYWTSSEHDNINYNDKYVYTINFNKGSYTGVYNAKNSHSYRSRLCFYI